MSSTVALHLLVDDVTVLVIEDDRDVAEMYQLRLAADGYVVRLAGDGSEGLRMALDELPDFIYLDLRLPGIDGFEVLKELRGSETTCNIPVIIVSNGEGEELRERGLKLGALEFLLKARTTPEHLSNAVRRSILFGERAVG